MLAVAPRHADAHFLLGMVALGRGAVGRALELIDRALALAPATAEYEAQAARCLALLHRDAEAMQRVEQTLATGIGDPRVLDTLGVVCARAGQHRQAAALFRHALDGRSDDAGIAFNLGSALRFVGEFDAAEQAFEQALQIDPRCFRAHSAIAALRRQTEDRNHLDRLADALATVGDDIDGELHLRHARATELEDLGRHAEAFAELETGKRRKRASLGYDFEQDRALFEAVATAFPPGFDADALAGSPTAEPIFVVGMPRSGTTLVERILSSHPEVGSAGELQNFGIALKRLAGTGSSRVLDPATVAAGRLIDPAALGSAYLESTRPLTGQRPHFVDKMPLNFLYLGFIRLALPNARLICLHRGAMDTCLSNFRQLFATGFSYYAYALDLETTAHYVVEFERLLAHWRRTLGGRLLEVGYEALVANPETEIRRLLVHCGLPFDERCLAFERNAAPVATASAVQVREPLHGRSIGRWHRYATELGPAARILEAAGIPLEAAPQAPA